MTYDEFKRTLNSLWKIKRSNLALWGSELTSVGSDIDDAIRTLEDNHRRHTSKFYSGHAFGQGDWER